ncbi:hypothetical protein DFJ77DRAFT_436635 [Powellomyces hirtus]|nr:hypothetical protein DFJ77DRAFT_436635 [Powellomyces hirtus]
MSPFGKSRKNNESPTPPPPAGSASFPERRRKHITSLHTSTLPLRELHPEALYEISFSTQSTGQLLLHVGLSPSFPDSPPTIQLRPPQPQLQLQHPWIVQGGYIAGHDRLANWDAGSAILLGKLVRDVVNEFTNRPPIRAQSSNINRPANMSSTPPPQQQQPTASTDYPDVDRLRPEDMHRLLKNEDALNAYFDDLEHVRNVRAVHRDLLHGNEALAKRNLIHEAELQTANESIAAQQTLLMSQIHAFEETSKSRDDAAMRFTPNYLTSALRATLTQCEAKSDEITNAFLSTSSDALSIDEFVKQFRDARTTYHLRAAKLERLIGDPRVLAQ